ncbi:hypothetical protein FDUTEX481_08785 [Tolypothrix sp. PCC 7601]|nr:hypothetical protein FDUTEX481_08785 [Tolypothrix sp. PCC 7601]
MNSRCHKLQCRRKASTEYNKQFCLLFNKIFINFKAMLFRSPTFSKSRGSMTIGQIQNWLRN